MEHGITEEDVNKFTALLNMVNRHATFNMSTSELISYYKLLSWSQASLKPKLEANIFEITKVTQTTESETNDNGE